MAKINALEKDEIEVNEPINIGDRALDNLRFIRETMERSAVFTSVSGYGGILMGATAIVAAYLAQTRPTIREWLTVWLIEAFLAAAIGFLSMWQKSKIVNDSLSSAPAKKFALGFLPPLVCGVIVTIGMWQHNLFEFMIPIWLLLYGASVVTGGSHSVKVIPIMGWCFMALGSAAFFLPFGYGNLLMGIGFGVLHVIFGIIIARRFGG